MQKAVKTENTGYCRNGDGMGCGVCDCEFIEPKVFEICKNDREPSVSGIHKKPTVYSEFKVLYSKRNQAKYFGQIELVKIFSRAIRRAGITVKFSEGFHPKPKISFEDALPIGLESLEECFYVFVSDNIGPQTLKENLNKHLPKGLRVIDCKRAPKKSIRKELSTATYIILHRDGFFDEKELEYFKNRHEFTFFRTNRKRKTKKIDLKEMVLNIDMIAPNRLKMTLKAEPGKTVRPFEVINNIFSIPEEKIRQASIVKVGAE